MFMGSQSKHVKFIIAGLINTSLNFLTLNALIEFFSIYYLYASATGFFIGALSGFILNFIWTFKNTSFFMKKFLKYFIIQVMNLVIAIIVVFFFKEYYSLNVFICQFIAVISTTLINFYLSSRFVFAKS